MLPAPTPHPVSRRVRFLLASTLILLFSFWLRTANLYGLPIFSFFDEADHVLWAQRFAAGNTVYPFLMDGKFLLGVVLSTFQLNGPSPLWLARCATAIVATLSCAACIAIGARLHSPRAGLLAGLIYAVLPQALFFEKQIFADPLMAAFGAAAAAITLKGVRRVNWFWATTPAIFLALAALTKLNGLTYLVFPLFAPLMLPGARPNRSRAIGYSVLTVALTAAFMAAFLFAFGSRLGQNDGNLTAGRIGFIGCPALVCEGNLPQQLDDLFEYGRNEIEALTVYAGWLVIVLALAAVPALRRRRQAAYFGLAALAMWVVFAFTAKGYVPARYMSFLAVPLAVLAAVGLFAVTSRLAAARPILARAFSGIVVLGLTIQFAPTAVALLTDFSKMTLASQDAPGYFAPGLGPGIREAALSLQPLARLSPPPVLLVGDIYVHLIGSYFDRTRIDVRGLGEAAPVDLGRWLSEGQPVFIIDQINNTPARDHVEVVGAYDTVGVWRVIGADSETRNQIFRALFPEPEKLTDDFNALINALPGAESTALLVYPPNQAQILAPLVAATWPNVSVLPIGDSWPLDVPAAEAELQAITTSHANIHIAFVEETKGDPQRRIETWLKTHLFVSEEQWFGPVRLVSFAGAEWGGEVIPAGARFGDGLTLESVEVLDPAPQPGSLVRVRLVWQVQSPAPRANKIFVHIFSGEAIVAQHDGQPVGELRPTDTWQVGETIVDQFAVRLPADVPPGQYQVRVGMYDLETQVRLPVTLPDGTPAEFWMGAAIEVK